MNGNIIKRLISACTLVAFVTTSVSSSLAQGLNMPAPGSMVSLSASFAPPLLKGVKVYADNPFRLDFILDKGNSSDSTDQLKAESTRLIKYFLASITVPEKDLWVNLSPYEKDRIVSDAFGVTEMGRDLLAQDYMLKQITASVIYPEGEVGKTFWAKVYAEAQKRYGTSDVPVDTFNKVWIVPEKAVVYESKDSAYVVESKLKVMLEEDYLALEKNIGTKDQDTSTTNKLGSDIVREVVIPILEKEVNEGKNFAQLRQVYHSLILAVWYKDKVRESIFGKAYVDQKKTGGVDIEDKAEKEKIWAQYVEAFKKGAYSYIKEDIDSVTQQPVPRKYFSGGFDMAMSNKLEVISDAAMLPKSWRSELFSIGTAALMLISAGCSPVNRDSWAGKDPIHLSVQGHPVFFLGGVHLPPFTEFTKIDLDGNARETLRSVQEYVAANQKVLNDYHLFQEKLMGLMQDPLIKLVGVELFPASLEDNFSIERLYAKDLEAMKLVLGGALTEDFVLLNLGPVFNLHRTHPELFRDKNIVSFESTDLLDRSLDILLKYKAVDRLFSKDKKAVYDRKRVLFESIMKNAALRNKFIAYNIQKSGEGVVLIMGGGHFYDESLPSIQKLLSDEKEISLVSIAREIVIMDGKKGVDAVTVDFRDADGEKEGDLILGWTKEGVIFNAAVFKSFDADRQLQELVREITYLCNKKTNSSFTDNVGKKAQSDRAMAGGAVAKSVDDAVARRLMNIVADDDPKVWEEAIRSEHRWHDGVNFGEFFQGGENLLVIGDTDHGFLGVQKGLVKRLEEIAKVGVKHLFLEIPSDQSIQEFERVVTGTWIPHVKRELIIRAQELGITIHFMDMPREQLGALHPVSPEGSLKRGQYMKAYLEDFFRQEPTARAVAITGYGHILDERQIPGLRDSKIVRPAFVAVVSEDQESSRQWMGFDRRLPIVVAVDQVTGKQGNYGYIDTVALSGFAAGWISNILFFARPAVEAPTAKMISKALPLQEAASLIVKGSMAGLAVIGPETLTMPAHNSFESGVSDRDANIRLNEGRILQFIAGLKGSEEGQNLTSGQKYYLATLLMAYVRTAHPRGVRDQGVIKSIGFVPQRQVFELEMETFGFVKRPDGTGSMPTRQFEVLLENLQLNFGYEGDFDVFDQLGNVAITNNPDRPVSAFKMASLIVAAKRHPERMAIEIKNHANVLNIYPVDITGLAKADRPVPLAELETGDFGLTKLEQDAWQLALDIAPISIDWFFNLGGAMKYRVSEEMEKDQDFVKARDAIEETEETGVAMGHAFGHPEFPFPPFAWETVDEVILNARKELRTINRQDALKILEVIKRRMAILERAVTLLDTYVEMHRDRIKLKQDRHDNKKEFWGKIEHLQSSKGALIALKERVIAVEKTMRQEFQILIGDEKNLALGDAADKKSGPDQTEDSQAPGGIDLTRDKMGLQVQNGGQGVQFKFDPAMIQQLQSASGLTPVVVDIQPMTTTVPMFLGIKDAAPAAGQLNMR